MKTHSRSKHLDEFLGERFDYVVTVCDNARTHHPDPLSPCALPTIFYRCEIEKTKAIQVPGPVPRRQALRQRGRRTSDPALGQLHLYLIQQQVLATF